MRLIPKGGNDIIMTPYNYVKAITKHFKPKGVILEPCRGTGIWYNYLREYSSKADIVDWCEIEEGKDFFNYTQKVDYIITNPPYSQMRKFIQHSMEISDNIIFLSSINHLWLKARLRDIKEKGFGIREICLCDIPKEFPQSGFQFGIFHLQKKYNGDIKLSQLDKK